MAAFSLNRNPSSTCGGRSSDQFQLALCAVLWVGVSAVLVRRTGWKGVTSVFAVAFFPSLDPLFLTLLLLFLSSSRGRTVPLDRHSLTTHTLKTTKFSSAAMYKNYADICVSSSNQNHTHKNQAVSFPPLNGQPPHASFLLTPPADLLPP